MNKMALDTFAVLDDHNKIIKNLHHTIWMAPLILLALMKNLHNKLTPSQNFLLILLKFAHSLATPSKGKQFGGFFVLFSSLMMMMTFLNLTNLMPYTFPMTTMMAINIAYAFPFWLTTIMLSLSFNPKQTAIHLLPKGTPNMLSPFIVMVEIVSILIRPLTMSVRLSANMTTGTILMTFVGSVATGSTLSMLTVSILGFGFFMFEVGIALIQTYIFVILPTYYINEHPE